MQLAGKKRGQVVKPHPIRRRQQAVFAFKARKGRRRDVDFELDLDNFGRSDLRRALLVPINAQNMLLRAAFEESRPDMRIGGLDFFFRPEIKSDGAEFAFQEGKIFFQAKIGVGSHQRKVQVLGKPVKPVKDTQRRPAVKGGFPEKAGAGKSAERNFLHDLGQRVLLLALRMSGIARKHLTQYALHHLPPSMSLTRYLWLVAP